MSGASVLFLERLNALRETGLASSAPQSLLNGLAA